MKRASNKFRKPDLMVILAIVVGLGAVVSTTVQAEERTDSVQSHLLVSYEGAIPTLKHRLARAAVKADQLIAGADQFIDEASAWIPAQMAADGSLFLGYGEPKVDAGLYLSVDVVQDQYQEMRAVETSGFVVDEEIVPSLSFRRRW